MRFVIYGAGAMGSVLGGVLALKKHDVLLICREEHAEAVRLQDGLRMKSATGEYFSPLEASATLTADDLEGEVCVLFTPKSNDTGKCTAEFAKIAPADIPLVCFQNGISNEEIISKKFANVYGGVCRMTCSLLQPGQVSFRKVGRVIVGKYPSGVDAFARKLGGMFSEAGLEATVARSIMCDKWLKLVVNLQSAFNAIVDPRDHDTLEFQELKIGVLEEAKKVLKADKIKAKSCDGRDFNVDEIIAELKKPRAARASSSMRVNNSTWQNLYLQRNEIENGFFHGPVIERAKTYGIPVPFNIVALEWVTKCCKEKLGPEVFRASEILEEIEKRGGAH